MSWISELKHFNTFADYPVATIAHILVGIWCGRELAIAEQRKNLSEAIGAIIVFFAWIAYETVEFARIRDNGDIDIANGIAGIFIGLFLHKLAFFIYNRFTKHRRTY